MGSKLSRAAYQQLVDEDGTREVCPRCAGHAWCPACSPERATPTVAEADEAERARRLGARVAELEAALDDGISIVMDFAPGHDVWLDSAAKLLENTIEAADAAKEQS